MMRMLAVAALVLAVSGCGMFSAREPEAPIADAGSFDQPDTPEQVVENIQDAISELNTLNYRRSLGEDLVYQPTASAEARDAIWSTWSRAQEEQYFSTLAAAAAQGGGHRLELNDRSFTLLSPERYQLDATYVLTVNHQRPDAPTRVQGRLIWLIAQRSADGLWELAEWTDQELAATGTWSDLKAEFVK